MGSSKTGSLDKFAAFSPAAALASGKVKLPETGIVGMLQANQEDKMNYNSQIMQQQQMQKQKDAEAAQYMQMMQQQSGMNMGGRVGFSEGSGPDMDRVLELEEQGFSYEEAFEKAMQERLDRGFNQGGRVEMGFGGSSGVATPQAGGAPMSSNSGIMGSMLQNLIQQNPELLQQMQQPGMAAGGRVGMSMGGNPDKFAPTNTKPYNPPMSIGMGGTMIPKQSEQPIKQPYTGGMGSGTPPPLRPPMAGDPGVDPTPGPGIQPQPMPMPSDPEIDYMGSMNMGPATNPGPSPFEMTNTNNTNTGGMGSGIEMNNTNSMLQNLIQNNPMLGAQPGMLGGYAAGGPVESMQFLKQHLPYQDGGHVALRRKMFKMGGPVNTHGVGITSGLEFRNNYNAGGSVRQNYVVGGGVKAGAFGLKILEKLRKLAGKGKPLVDSVTRPYIDPVSYIRGARTAADAKFKQKAFQALTRGVRGAATAGAYGAPVGILSAAADRAGLEYADPDSDVREDANLLERGVRRVRQLGEGLTDYATIPGDALFIGDALTKDPNMEGITLTDLIANRPREEIASLDKTGVASKSQMTLDELKEQNAVERQANLQAAMEQYAELLAGSDNTNKLATLGDALIAGGSALMEGEGYGAAGRAFNEPLSGARRSKEERMAAANSSAAQLAISENMQIDAENRAVVNEFMKTGSFTDAEQAQLMALAQETGGARLIPENEDGEIDENVVNQPGVYADPKNLSGKGTLFIAIDSGGVPIYTNDPKEAKAHSAS